MLGSRIRAALGAASIALLALALVAPAGAAAKDGGKGKHHGHTRKAAMQVCKKGGWKTVEKADGTRFKNQGRCVSYLVRGGAYTQIAPAVTVTMTLTDDQASCDATGAVKDFGANQSYTGDVTGGTVPQVQILTDASGEGSTSLGNVLLGTSVVLTVNGLSAGATCEAPPPAPVDPV